MKRSEMRPARQTELLGPVTKKSRSDEKHEVVEDARSKEELRMRKKMCPICYRSLRRFRVENRIPRLFLSCKPNCRKAMGAAATSRMLMKKKAMGAAAASSMLMKKKAMRLAVVSKMMTRKKAMSPKPSDVKATSPKPSEVREVKAASPKPSEAKAASPKPSEVKEMLADAESIEKGSKNMPWGGERMRKIVADAEWKKKGNNYFTWGEETTRKMAVDAESNDKVSKWSGDRMTRTETWKFSANYLVFMRNTLPPLPVEDFSTSNPFLRMNQEIAAAQYKARHEFCDYVFSQHDVRKGYSEFQVEVTDDGEVMVPAKFRDNEDVA